MYSILIKPESNLPFIISRNTLLYCDYIDSGYQEITVGTKKELMLILDECIVAYAD